jgi:V/A-type H+-transporting ATPase subunit D
MSTIKHTKTELKAQTDALRRFQRFLPMLQLKKQQLQMEIAAITVRRDSVRDREKQARAAVDGWSRIFADTAGAPDLGDLAVLQRITTAPGNIAGVPIPIYSGVTVTRKPLDLFDTPPWLDDAQDAVEQIIALRAEATVLECQRERIACELLTTSQRVNLFEKVKIPECRDNIRVIRIFLGDEQTASVARGKIAKRRSTSPNTAQPHEEDAA